MSEEPAEFTADAPAERPWWKRPWGIAVLAFAGLFVLAGVVGEEPDEGPADVAAGASADAGDEDEDADEEPDDADASASDEPSAQPEPSPEPETLVVPTLVGVDLGAARDRLERYDVTVEVERVAPGLLDPVGVVVAQDPERVTEVDGIVTLTATEAAWNEPITLSGSGDDVVELATPDDAAAVLELTHDGSSNFAVFSLDQAGSQTDLLVNEIGSYAGSRLVNLGGSNIGGLEISASGAWQVVARPLRDAPRAEGGALDGSGDAVVLLPDGADASRLTLTHDGSSNVAVFGYATSGASLLVNDIGAYEGTVRLDGAVVLDVTADGNWTLRAE